MKTIQIILLALWTINIALFSGCKEPPVTKSEVKVTGVALNKKDLALVPGEMVQLIATVEPEDANNKQVTWRSDNPSVAIVDENGLVTAIKDGRTDVGVFTQDGDYRDLCLVKVDYRTHWIGRYDCEKRGVRAVIDIAARGDSILYIVEKNPASQNIYVNHEVKIDDDGSFDRIGESGSFRITGSFYNDSIYFHLYGGGSTRTYYRGVKIKE